MTREEVEEANAELLGVTALKVDFLEQQVAMLAAALGTVRDHLADQDLDEAIDEAMAIAKEEKKAKQQEEREAAREWAAEDVA